MLTWTSRCWSVPCPRKTVVNSHTCFSHTASLEIIQSRKASLMQLGRSAWLIAGSLPRIRCVQAFPSLGVYGKFQFIHELNWCLLAAHKLGESLFFLCPSSSSRPVPEWFVCTVSQQGFWSFTTRFLLCMTSTCIVHILLLIYTSTLRV